MRAWYKRIVKQREPTNEFPGVDIDRIYYVLGLKK
jgi:hypothetical protein